MKCVFGGEYSGGSITSTFVATPERGFVFASKAATICAVTAVASAAAVAMCTWFMRMTIGSVWLSVRPTSASDWRVLLGVPLYLVGIGLLG